ncbi:hypothetical protein [Neolewinella agarilytica]|uniref:Uncharacterized protein n=1 Tax=Neolewinella agarilytica TaxID=478744 RepID=A0A1H9J3C4_9BACT|nr:hypothetical protein [Neolewinella agarilytica]SEQ81541.1 hypothetical protein SAMN05444359_11679 [Neolewinella agarilytica]
MKAFFTLLLTATVLTLSAQTEKPPYCEEGPATYGSVAAIPGATTAPPLPRFTTTPVTEHKIQVAILRYTDPSEYPFHPSLVARYRPCEQLWVVESRESFANRADAVKLQNELKALGYSGAYITDLVGYQ